MRAKYPDLCGRCHQPIQPGDDVIRHHDYWMHRTCASGNDDE